MKKYNSLVIALLGLVLGGCQWASQDSGLLTINLDTAVSRAYGGLPNPVGGKILVSAPDYPDFETSFLPDGGAVNVKVPYGFDRKITVTLFYPPSNSSFVRAREGSTTFNFHQGEKKAVSVKLDASETPIVVPDANNKRLVQIENMTGAGWQTFTGSQLAGFDANYSTGYTFEPRSLDFDKDGNLYFYDYNNPSGIFIMSGIDGTSFTQAGKGSYTVVALAVDRPRGVVYFVNSSGSLHVYNIGTGVISATPVLSTAFGLGYSLDYGSNPTAILPGAALAVDPDGLVYFTGKASFAGTNHPYVGRINPLDPPASLSDPKLKYVLTDTAAGGPYLNHSTLPVRYAHSLHYSSGHLFLTGVNRTNALVMNSSFPYASVLLKTDTSIFDAATPDLSSAKAFGYGSYNDSASFSVLPFGAPREFAAFYGKKLIILDQTSVSGMVTRLVEFDPVQEKVDAQYGSYGSSVGQFNFLQSLYNC